MRKTNKLPIKRNRMFYGEEDFLLEQEMGMDYIIEDCSQTVVLYRVNRENTFADDLYGEAKSSNVSYYPPIELPCRFNLADSKNNSYDKNKGIGRFIDIGNLTVSIYNQTLIDYDTDIQYGDYIGLQVDEETVEYFTVVNDGKKDYGNKKTMFGTKPFYRTIECVYVDPAEFNG